MDERFKYDYNCPKFNPIMERETIRRNNQETQPGQTTLAEHGKKVLRFDYYTYNVLQSIAFLSQIPAPILIKLFIEWLGES